jgi:glyoxalase family protein
MSYLNGSHHVTMCVGTAQEDVDFHTDTLGLRFIKRTVLFDGSTPIYHLYYSNAAGDPSSVLTTFPFAQAGLTGVRGTNQAREVQLAVPTSSLNYWHDRLGQRGIEVTDAEVFERRRLLFRHPSGIEYAMVGVDGDERIGYGENGVPVEHAIHGIYGVGIHVNDPERMVEFVSDQMGGASLSEEGDRAVLRVGEKSQGGSIELVVNRTDPQGTWRFGAGTIHHFAWNADNLDNQGDLRFEIEGIGYTDISELKDRKYFKSVYVRSPGGALFELAVTHSEGGWDCDERHEELGMAFQLPEQFEDRRDEIFSMLEPIEG